MRKSLTCTPKDWTKRSSVRVAGAFSLDGDQRRLSEPANVLVHRLAVGESGATKGWASSFGGRCP